jgi:methyl-accepting chemotaxis protein
MKIRVGAKISSGFALALIIQIFIGLVSYRHIQNLSDTAQWVKHTHIVRHELNDLLSAIQDAETGQRGFIITGKESYLEPYNSGIDSIQSILSKIKSLTSDNPSQQQRIDALKPRVEDKIRDLERAITIRKGENGLEAAIAVVNEEKGKQYMDIVRKAISEMDEEEVILLEKRDEAAEASAKSAKIFIILGSLGSLLVLSVVSILLTQNISKPLQHITTIAERISLGDLTSKISVSERSDEIGMLMHAFSDMMLLLIEQTKEISAGVNSLAASSTEISSMTSQLAASSSETSSAVAQSTSTVEEIKQIATLAAGKTRSVADGAQKALATSELGAKSVEETAAVMRRIRGQMESVAQSIVSLSNQSQAIGEIVSAVSDLADQSNLLAVNASIEAARAGEHGRGFSVVAQEIQSLAEQSKNATSKVRAILADIQKATSGAVMSIEQGNKAVEIGVAQAENSGKAIGELAEIMSGAAQAASQIAVSSQQQSAGMDQVALAMKSINSASLQTADSTRQAEGSARNLKELGLRLQKLVERYKI